jgi:hypothetical protein
VTGPVLLIFIAAAELGGAPIQALEREAARALGPDARVLVRGYQRLPESAEMADAGRAAQATAVARVAWSDAGRTRASLELVVVGTGEVLDRVVAFRDADPLVERGRTLGFVLASLTPSESPRAPPPPSLASPAATPAPSLTAPLAAPADPRWALEAFAAGAQALGGAGAGVGGGVAVRWLPGSWGLRVGARARSGSVGEAQASSLALAVSAGALRSLVHPGRGGGFGLAVRADLLLLYEALSHFSSDDRTPVRGGRILPGAAALIEAEARLAPSASLHLAAGLEAAGGVTDIYVHRAKVAELVPFRGLIELGFRTRF